ncbi:MAG: Ig-like domain-containing protein [Myxococcota bacterium]
MNTWGRWVVRLATMLAVAGCSTSEDDGFDRPGNNVLDGFGDILAPTIEITNPLNGSELAPGQLTITGLATDNVAVTRVEVTINTESPEPASGTDNWTYLTPALVDGTYLITARAFDARNNSTEALLTVTLRTGATDGTKPTVTITEPTPGSLIGAGTFMVRGTATDNVAVAQVQVSLNLGTPVLATGTDSWAVELDASNLATGTHSILATVGDDANNSDFQLIDFLVDRDLPQVAVSGGPVGGTSTSDSITIDVGGPNVSTYTYTVDGGASTGPVSANTPITLTDLDDGTYTVVVTGISPTGQSQPTPTTYVFTVDTTPPTVATTNGPPSVSSSSSVNIDVGGEGVDSFRFRVNGGAYSAPVDAGTPLTLDGLADGAYTIEVVGIDAVGNQQVVPTVYNFTVDTTAPSPVDVLLTGAPGPSTSTGNVNLTVGGPGIAEYYYTVNGGPLLGPFSVDDPLSLPDLEPGDYSIEIFGSDGGNISETGTVLTFTVDPDAPAVEVINDPPPVTSGSTVTIDVGGPSDVPGPGVDAYTYEVTYPLPDGGTETQTVTTPVSSGTDIVIDFTSPRFNGQEGTYTVTITGDSNGPISPPTVVDVVYDVTPPSPDDVSLSGLPPAVTSQTSVAVRVEGDGVAAYQYTFDGGPVTGPFDVTELLTLTGLSDGSHTLEVFAIDEAGNVATTPETYTFTVNTSEPVATITGAPAPDQVLASDRVELDIGGAGVAGFRYSINNGPISDPQPADRPLVLNDLPFGLNQISVYAINDLGVLQSTPTVVSWFVDARMPELAVFGAPAGATTDQSFALDIGGTAVASYTYSFENGIIQGPFDVSQPILLGPLDPGTYTVSVNGISPSGIQTPQSNITIVVVEGQPLSGEAVFLEQISPANSTFIDVDIGGPGVVSYEWRLCLNANCEGTNFNGPISVSDPLQFNAPEGEHIVEIVGINADGERQADPTRSTLVVDATPPEVLLTPTFVVTSLDELVFTFSEAIDPDSVSLSGSLVPINYPRAAISGSMDNTTLTLAPPGLGWTVVGDGTPQTLTIEYTDEAGNAETVELELVVALDTAVVHPSFIGGAPPPDAYESIQDALDNVAPGTLVQVVGGTYTESIRLTGGENVAFIGGVNPSDPTQRDPSIWPTIIAPFGSPSGITPVVPTSDYADPLQFAPDAEPPPTDAALFCAGASQIFSLIDGIEFQGPVVMGENCDIVFSGNRVLGEVGSGNGYGIYAYAGTSAQVLGNEIVGGSQNGVGYGVYIVDAGQMFFLSSNTIDGGHGNPMSVGVYTHGPEAVVIDDNTIFGGSGNSGGHPSRGTCNAEGLSIGVYMSNTRSQLSDNLVTGGGLSPLTSAPCNHTGISRSRGVYVAGVNAPPEQIFANGILAGGSFGGNCTVAGSESIGVDINSEDGVRLSYTFVQGGYACDGAGTAIGVSIDAGAGPVTLWNAIVLGGTIASDNTSVLMVDSTNVKLFNNLFFAETDGRGNAVVSSGSDPELINNIIYGWDVGYSELAASSEPSVLSNNAIQSDMGSLYYDADTTSELSFFTQVADQAIGSTVSGNVDRGVWFVDADGPDDDPLQYPDNDWSLSTATSCNVGMGGQEADLTGLNLDTIDIDETARTADPRCGPTNDGAAGWSMGVFEVDADFGRDDLVVDPD